MITVDGSSLILDWLSARAENIRDNVSAADVLSYHGVELSKYHGEREEQISCPFHGEDKNPSAKYYPDESDSPSHLWCFACHKRWDAIGLWIEFNGKEKFSRTLGEIERAFHLSPPEKRDLDVGEEPEHDPLKEEVSRLFESCENRLRKYREYFDLVTHLKLGSLLDQLHYVYAKGGIQPQDAKAKLDRVLDKIGEKIRAATAINS